MATRSRRMALACNPSAREAEQQDRVPSRRRLHRQALPLKHNASRPKGGRRSTLPHSGPGGTNLSPRNSHETGLEFAEILLPDWVTCPCLKPTTASIQSGWMEKQSAALPGPKESRKWGMPWRRGWSSTRRVSVGPWVTRTGNLMQGNKGIQELRGETFQVHTTPIPLHYSF